MEMSQEFCDGFIGFRDQHKGIYKVTNVTKYRSFQYRLLQRGLVTNIHLEKWGILPSRLCSFCHTEPETLSHMFWTCSIVQEIWEEVAEYISTRFNTQELSMSLEAIITNQLVPVRHNVANFICLITKQYIYSQRCMGKNLAF